MQNFLVVFLLSCLAFASASPVVKPEDNRVLWDFPSFHQSSDFKIPRRALISPFADYGCTDYDVEDCDSYDYCVRLKGTTSSDQAVDVCLNLGYSCDDINDLPTNKGDTCRLLEDERTCTWKGLRGPCVDNITPAPTVAPTRCNQISDEQKCIDDEECTWVSFYQENLDETTSYCVDEDPICENIADREICRATEESRLCRWSANLLQCLEFKTPSPTTAPSECELITDETLCNQGGQNGDLSCTYVSGTVENKPDKTLGACLDDPIECERIDEGDICRILEQDRTCYYKKAFGCRTFVTPAPTEAPEGCALKNDDETACSADDTCIWVSYDKATGGSTTACLENTFACSEILVGDICRELESQRICELKGRGELSRCEDFSTPAPTQPPSDCDFVDITDDIGACAAAPYDCYTLNVDLESGKTVQDCLNTPLDCSQYSNKGDTCRGLEVERECKWRKSTETCEDFVTPAPTPVPSGCALSETEAECSGNSSCILVVRERNDGDEVWQCLEADYDCTEVILGDICRELQDDGSCTWDGEACGAFVTLAPTPVPSGCRALSGSDACLGDTTCIYGNYTGDGGTFHEICLPSDTECSSINSDNYLRPGNICKSLEGGNHCRWTDSQQCLDPY